MTPDEPEAHPKAARPSPLLWVGIIGGAALVFGCCFLGVFVLFIPNLIEARKTGNEAEAIRTLRILAAVQEEYRYPDRAGDETDLHYATSLAGLSAAGLIDNVLGSGTKSGYRFGLSGGTHEWLATATPVSESTGRRNFIICTDGVVRFSGEAPATCESPPIQ